MSEATSASAALTGAAPAAGGAEGGAPAGAEGGTPAGGQPTGNDAEWFSSFDNEELRGYAQKKGWKGPEAVTDSYRNLEKLNGVPPERLVKLPKEDAGEEEWGGVWDQLGRPEKPEDYGFEAPEGSDGAFAKWMGDTFHKAGVPTGMARKIADAYQEFSQQVQQQQEDAHAQRVDTEAAALKLEWGAAGEQNMAVAQRAVRGLGVDEKTVDALEKAMGYAGVMKFFHSLGSKMGESDFVAGSSAAPGGGGALSPDQAQVQIKELRTDKNFVKRYNDGDRDAREQMAKLHKQAYPE